LALGVLALGALVALVAAPNNSQQPLDSQAVIRRYRRSVADPTTLSSEALELLTKRHFYEQQKTRYPCYKTFYVGKLKYFTIASLYFWRMRRIRHRLCQFAEAKWQMANPVFLLKGRLLALSANIRLGWPFAIRFSELAKPVANAPHSPERKALAIVKSRNLRL